MKRHKPFIFVTLGFPGSGKTYFAERFSKQFNIFHLNSDRLRLEMIKDPRYTRAEHAQVFNTMDYIAEELLKIGQNVIYDTNPTRRVFRKRVQDLAERQNAKYVLLYFETPLQTALKRISTRGNAPGDNKVNDTKNKYYRKVEPSVLHNIRRANEPPTTDEPTIYLDGTIPYSKQLEVIKKSKLASL